MSKLTSLERIALKALLQSSAANGHDFGFTEDATDAVGAQSVAGVISSLKKKKLIAIHEKINGFTQFTFTESGFELAQVLQS